MIAVIGCIQQSKVQLLNIFKSQTSNLAGDDYRYELSPPIMIYSIIQN